MRCDRLAVEALLPGLGTTGMSSARLVDALMKGPARATGRHGLFVPVAYAASVLVVTGLAMLVSRRRGPRDRIAIGAGLAVASGYVVLEAIIRSVAPQQDVLTPLASRYRIAALRMAVLLPYAGLVAWLASRLMGTSGGTMRERLGLIWPRWSSCLLALACAGLVTVPWPLTGALGDSLTSLAVSVQMVSSVVPEIVIFWGVIYALLTVSFDRRRMAGVTTILVYTMSVFGGARVAGGAGALTRSLLLLPLALLLMEMRARGGSVLPMLPLALSYQLAPALFVDPRDVVANGIPDLQHILSHLAVALTAMVLAVLLWLGRRLWERYRGGRLAEERRRTVASVVAGALLPTLAWGLWIALYLAAGKPGFSNDGFLIIMKEQANLEAAYHIPRREARLSTVYEALVETAESSQRGIRNELESLGVPYRPYYIINMIGVDGHRWMMDRFAHRPEVASVILNPNVRDYPRRIPWPLGSGGAAGGVQGNLAAIRADAAWQMGVQGEGIVVGGQDTGYDWTHPALKAQYRGWDGEAADHDYSWHDAWDETREPFDDDSHGTHTMGTVLGDDGSSNRIGVAPGATWFGCRNMRRGIGNPGSYAECMEFLLAPYPLGGDPFHDGKVGLAAHVTNNSWGCPRMEGCRPETLGPAVEALRAAGIMMVVSAGNDGPTCSTATTPPVNYDASFAVGATSDRGEIVDFSSRGPADGLMRPDIAAPGQLIRSSLPGGGYGTAAGTSAAAPHVVGTVALVWSANESFMGDIDATERLLCETAVPKPVSRACTDGTGPASGPSAAATPGACACGGLSGVPNNVYGCGFLDAGAAVERALEE